MITVRYHIASLCAMILSLGIGISIGLVLGQNIEKHEADLVKQYYHKLHDLNQQQQDDANLISQNRQALSALVPHFTRALLTGKRIAIIRVGDFPAAAQSATDAVTLAGATVTSSITLSSQLDDVTVKDRQGILGSLETASDSSADPADNSALFRTIAQSLKQGTTNHQAVQDAIDRMSSFGYISYSGDFLQPVDLVVVVGGSSLQSTDPDCVAEQSRETLMLGQLVSTGDFTVEQVVGCEPLAAITSSIPIYQQAGIGSVDCIDEPLGALDIVYDLRGEYAAYGQKPSAHALMPQSIQTENEGE